MEERSRESPRAGRGILVAMVFSVPLWVLIIMAFWKGG
jgi:hypothetical protein